MDKKHVHLTETQLRDASSPSTSKSCAPVARLIADGCTECLERLRKQGVPEVEPEIPEW